MEDVLTIIPAKGRSTRIPGKNMALLGGKPLVLHAIEQAFAAGVCGEVCVATDDRRIADMARAAGAAVPFLRSDDVDDVTSVGVAALNTLIRYREELGRSFRHLCLLLTTSPMRRPEDITGCRDMLLADPALDAAMSFVYAEKHPCWAWRSEDRHLMSPLFPDRCDLGRAKLPRAYYVDGAVYWAKADFFEQAGGNQYVGRVGGYIMSPEYAVDVDTPLDLAFCEFLYQSRLPSGSQAVGC